MLDIKPVVSPKFSLQARENRIEISGSLEMANAKEVMEPFFREVHGQSRARGMKSVLVDTGKLIFMNSSALKEMTSWILKQMEMQPNEVYDIIFQINPEISWQMMTFVSLQWLNKDHIQVSPKP